MCEKEPNTLIKPSDLLNNPHAHAQSLYQGGSRFTGCELRGRKRTPVNWKQKRKPTLGLSQYLGKALKWNLLLILVFSFVRLMILWTTHISFRQVLFLRHTWPNSPLISWTLGTRPFLEGFLSCDHPITISYTEALGCLPKNIYIYTQQIELKAGLKSPAEDRQALLTPWHPDSQT